MDTLLIVFAVIIILFIAVCLGGGIGMFCFALKRPKKGPDPMTMDDYSEHMNPFMDFLKAEKQWLFSTGYDEVEITSFDGLRLKGILVYAPEKSKKTVIAIHGYKNCGINEYSSYIRNYHEMGFNVLVPDDRAHGKSEGKFIGFAWLDRRDCIDWIKFAVNKFGEDSSVLLHGISMGSATVMNASGESDLPKQVKAIVSDCGYSCAWDQFKHVLKRNFHLHSFPVLYVANVINKLINKYDFKENSSVNQVKKASVPFLFIHGGDDDFVPTEMVHEVYNACASIQKEVHVFEGAAHAESYYVCHDEYLKVLRNFINKIDF
ncbi:MAG: alpha/beta hydrolase [Clostridia bacterium]|nr:alpha/beta hydrolase [Clostridia bacterium]